MPIDLMGNPSPSGGAVMKASPERKPRKKSAKPYPSFPLTAHNNGQWCKKIRGKVHFFGVWSDPQNALAHYLGVAADLHAGRPPNSSTVAQGDITIKDICNAYLTHQLQKVDAGEITPRSFEDCRSRVEDFAVSVRPHRLVSDIGPADFQQYRASLTRRRPGRKKRPLGVYALNRGITIIRSMFKHAYEADLIERPVKFGTGFAKPSASLKRKLRRTAELENGKRLFELPEVRSLLDSSKIPMRAMILLAVNGGFGNTDCARLRLKAVDLEQAVIEFDRPKTGVERTVPLWPEAVQALREALDKRPRPADEEAEKLVFLTSSGRPWVRENVHRSENNGIEKVVPIDMIAQEFGKLLTRLGLKRKGVGFYALRHTFRTWADEVRDQHAIHRIMGHAIPGMSGIYVEKIELQRLRAVVDHVRAKLFEKPGAAPPGEPNDAT